MTKRLRHKKLWTLVRDAVKDLEKVSEDERYTLNMGSWHSPNGKCAVCVAGAVIAGTLDASPNESLTPACFDARTGNLLDALDDIRIGDIDCALESICVTCSKEASEGLNEAWTREMVGIYNDTTKQLFLSAWRTFAAKAKEIGV